MYSSDNAIDDEFKQLLGLPLWQTVLAFDQSSDSAGFDKIKDHIQILFQFT